MPVILTTDSLDPAAEITRCQAQQTSGAFGARVDFTGYLRDFNEGRQVSSLFLEHYPGMTEKAMSEVCDRARSRWPVQEILLVHRVGNLLPGDPIVLITVWSIHRSDAFDACRFLISELKRSVPLWKQERSREEEVWVARNTLDPNAPVLPDN